MCLLLVSREVLGIKPFLESDSNEMFLNNLSKQWFSSKNASIDNLDF